MSNSNLFQLIHLPNTSKKYEENMFPLDILTDIKTVIVLSPHLDDAILSLGSLLTGLVKLDKNIQIINFFTKGSKLNTALTQRLLNQAKKENITEYFLTRKEEDNTAFKKIDTRIKILNLDFIDAAWRINKNKESTYPKTILCEISEDDTTMELVEDYLKDCAVDKQNTAIFAPIARGKHVDHQIIRNIASKIFPKVYYYCDFPYSALYPFEDEFINQHNLSAVNWYGDYSQKKDLILTYKSQLGSFFKSSKTLSLPYETFYYKLGDI